MNFLKQHQKHPGHLPETSWKFPTSCPGKGVNRLKKGKGPTLGNEEKGRKRTREKGNKGKRGKGQKGENVEKGNREKQKNIEIVEKQ